MMRSVFLATDGSQAALKAADAASELVLSLRPPAELHVASVVDYAPVPGFLGRQPEGAPDLLRDEAEAALRVTCERATAAGVTCHPHLLEGDVVEALLACAQEVRADLLVAGFHGKGRLARLVMGSVVGRLVRSTLLPVMVVRMPEE